MSCAANRGSFSVVIIPAHGRFTMFGQDSLGIPQLHDKRLDPMFLALDDELCEDRAVRCR